MHIFSFINHVDNHQAQDVWHDSSALKWLAFTFPCWKWKWNVSVKTLAISQSDSIPRFFNVLAIFIWDDSKFDFCFGIHNIIHRRLWLWLAKSLGKPWLVVLSNLQSHQEHPSHGLWLSNSMLLIIHTYLEL